MGRADGDRGLGSSPNQFPGLDRFLSPGTSVKSFRGEGCGPVAEGWLRRLGFPGKEIGVECTGRSM